MTRDQSGESYVAKYILIERDVRSVIPEDQIRSVHTTTAIHCYNAQVAAVVVHIIRTIRERSHICRRVHDLAVKSFSPGDL